jgi:arylsulfatase A
MFLLLGPHMASAGKGIQNFVVILTDDQGFGDIGVNGLTKAKTRRIDAMAEEGIHFQNWYSASSVCSPSRAAMLTGRYPKRAGVPSVLFPWSTEGMNPDELTIAELLKGSGYKTACVGKWHLGHHQHYLPTNQGFDFFFGIPFSNDMSIAAGLEFAEDCQFFEGMTREIALERAKQVQKNESREYYQSVRDAVPLMRNEAVIEYPTDQRFLTRRITEESARFIKENQDHPFFLLVSHPMPHTPLFVHPEFEGKSGSGLFWDIIEEIDWSVGEIIDTLTRLGIAEDTLIIFLSDNGPAYRSEFASPGPFRGKKFTSYEGGHRVPAVAWSPGNLKPRQLKEQMVSSMDLFKTFAHYADVPVPEDLILDGKNIAGLLEGDTDTSPYEVFYYYLANSNQLAAIRGGDWKYIMVPDGVQRKAHPQLYDLQEDDREQNDVIKDHPERVDQLWKRMNSFDSEISPSSNWAQERIVFPAP